MTEIINPAPPWRRYEPIRTGQCLIETAATIISVRYELGTVHTGRSRVFVGFFVKLTPRDGVEWLGEHPYSLRRALRRLAVETLASEGWRFADAPGLSGSWYETGLSANTGFGYVTGDEENGPVLMISPAELAPVR